MPRTILAFSVLLFFSSIPGTFDGNGSPRQLPGIAPCNDMSQMEMNKCFDAEFHKVDAHLNEVYGKLLSAMKDDLADGRGKHDVPEIIVHDKEQIRKLSAAESGWLTYRDLHCAAARHQTEPGTVSSTIWSVCLTTVTNHRIEEIHDAYDLQGPK